MARFSLEFRDDLEKDLDSASGIDLKVKIHRQNSEVCAPIRQQQDRRVHSTSLFKSCFNMMSLGFHLIGSQLWLC